MVYEYVLLEPEHIAINTHKPLHHRRRPCRSSFRDKRFHQQYDWDAQSSKWIDQPQTGITSLLRLNKEVLQEAASALYTNTFSFETMTEMLSFLQILGGSM